MFCEIDAVDPGKRAPSVEFPWLEGEAMVNKLCELFGLECSAVELLSATCSFLICINCGLLDHKN